MDKFYDGINITPKTPVEQLPTLLTPKQLGAFFGLHKNGLYDLMRQKGFPVIFITSKKRIIPKELLIKWLEKQAGG